ncbi:transmembrane protein 59-like [Leptinotarsa decemlineata]|uniref:transmembrane protein 59-like n=1 Tax=Leptinotarsa decemlineata TaxID=7539 RepID=UPI000C254288|nr:transmembrane protein 59-like [Leptinotarsa decemlineata]
MKDLRVFVIFVVFADYAASSPFWGSDQCVNICKRTTLPALDLDYYEQVVCQRGCKFFNIIKLKDDSKINTTKKECFISCEETYIVKEENNICKTGCSIMAKEQENLVSTLILETENSIVLASPEREIEFDLFSDPSIRNQLEIGFNVDYKIPETHIRTMPIEITEEEIRVKESGDWLDCASRNSGIPRWILLSAILSAVLIALWLSFSSEKRNSTEEEISEIDIPDDKLILEHDDSPEKDPCLLEQGPVLFVENINYQPEAPPKYTLENDKV